MITNIGKLLAVAVLTETRLILIGKWKLGVFGALLGVRAEETPL